MKGTGGNHHSVNMPHIGIVILTWNGLDFTRRCLETLRDNTRYPDYSVMVVDNGSTDGTLEFLKTLPWVRVIANGTNLGFVKGNNRGIRELDAACDAVLLNNDVEILQPEWLERLRQTAYSAADIAVVGCRLARPDGTLRHAGSYMPLETYWGQQIGGGEKDINQYNTDRDVEGVVFACVYLKRATLTRLGLLDEDYFSYFEDTDYCLRARAGGYRVVCCGSVTVVHHENVSTSVNQVKHSDMFSRSQAIFKSKWAQHLEGNRYNRELGWHSIFNLPTGYAISSRQLALALDKLGVKLHYRYVYGPGTPCPYIEPEMSDTYMVNVIRSRTLKQGGIQVVYGQGDVFERNTGDYRIGFTMLETDHIPAEWVRQANLMDEVWVPSNFNLQTFRESGVRRPIHVIPLGVDPNYFNPRITGWRIPEVFSFLSVFEWGERKAPEVLLTAFNDEFDAREPVVLLCKTLNIDPDVDVQTQIRALNLHSGGGRIIMSLNEVVPSYQLGTLYRSVDCFVLPTRGEGWGMPILEAMACGVPVIATNWSAHCDFMNEESAYPLAVEKLVPARAKCPYYRGFSWAQPSYEHLRVLMRHVYEDREEARAKALRAAVEVATRWTWESAARKIIDRLDAIGAERSAD